MLYVVGRFREVEIRQVSSDADPLQDGQKLCLANQDQAHRRIAVHPEVREKAYLLKHLMAEQMGFIDDHHRGFSLAFSHVHQHCVQLAFGVPTIELFSAD